MHFLCGPEGFTDFGYKHRHPIHPIIKHVVILNINKVVHKLIEWWGKEKYPNAWGVASGTLMKRIARLRKVCNIRDIFQLKLKRRKIGIKLTRLKWNLERWVLIARKWPWVHYNPLHMYLEAIAFRIRLDLLKNFEVIWVK
jgi:hypothetical protein